MSIWNVRFNSWDRSGGADCLVYIWWGGSRKEKVGAFISSIDIDIEV
jgi:hypothetical protein